MALTVLKMEFTSVGAKYKEGSGPIARSSLVVHTFALPRIDFEGTTPQIDPCSLKAGMPEDLEVVWHLKISAFRLVTSWTSPSDL